MINFFLQIQGYIQELFTVHQMDPELITQVPNEIIVPVFCVIGAVAWFFIKLIVYIVISLAISYLMQDDGPETPAGAKPGTFEAPIVTASDSIPVLFGERLLKSPNVVWYGNVTATPYYR